MEAVVSLFSVGNMTWSMAESKSRTWHVSDVKSL